MGISLTYNEPLQIPLPIAPNLSREERMQPQFETYPYESQLPLPPLFLQKNNSISSYVHIPLGLSKFAAVSSSLSSVLLFSAFEGEGKGSIEIFGPIRFLGADAEAAFLLAPPEGIVGDRRTPRMR